MFINAVKARHLRGYKLSLSFKDDTEMMVDLEQTIFKDKRDIFKPLRYLNYLKNFASFLMLSLGLIRLILHGLFPLHLDLF